MTTKKTILIVEDDPIDVILVERAFRRIQSDAALHIVNDGDSAIAYLNGDRQYSDRDEYPLPFVIVLDLNLPRRSGFDVLHWVRSSQLVSHLPVVVLTSSKLDADLRRAYRSGANSYLFKTPSQEDLVAMAETLNRYWGNFNRLPTRGAHG